MYINFRDTLLCVIKAIVGTIIVIIMSMLGIFNYHLGVNYCEYMKIPKDFTLTMVSPGMAIEITIVMYVFEFIILYFTIKSLRNFRVVDEFYDFLDLHY